MEPHEGENQVQAERHRPRPHQAVCRPQGGKRPCVCTRLLYAAVHRLFHDNLWIKQAGFSESKIFIRQIITHTQRHDIQEMINYILEEIFPSVKKLGNWESMEDYNNILHVLKRLKDLSTIQK